jgi:alpha-galactosidase
LAVVADARVVFPAFGTNSWNSIRGNLNEQFVRQTIDAVVRLNLTAYGFEYVNLDDGWAHVALGGRYSNGTVIVDSAAFPNGIAPLAQYAHKHGLKLGIYSDRGTATCMGRTGSEGFEAIDAATYASWGIDFLKEDSCFASSNHTVAFAQYGTMKKALDSTGRSIYFSLCGWAPWYAPVGKTLGNSWRISGDVNSWEDALVAIDINSQLSSFASMGHFNDPDMLLGSSPGTAVSLTPARSRTQFSLWCIMMAPLMIGADLRNMSAWDIETYTNAELIAINRDKLFIQGQRIVGGNLTGLLPVPYPVVNVWAKPLSDGSVAMLFLNNAPFTRTVACDSACFARVGLAGVVNVRDVWTHSYVGSINTAAGFARSVAPWGASEVYVFS